MHWSQAKGRKYAALIIITHKTVMFVEKWTRNFVNFEKILF
jgi:hypothetical protein